MTGMTGKTRENPSTSANVEPAAKVFFMSQYVAPPPGEEEGTLCMFLVFCRCGSVVAKKTGQEYSSPLC